MSENKKLNKTKKFPIFTVGLFVLVLVATIGLYIYNIFLSKQIDDIKSEIVTVNSSIKEIKKDKNLQIYSLLEVNKSNIKELEKRNKVTDYIDHLKRTSMRYSVKFSGFNMSDGKITTKALSETSPNNKILAYMKLRDFIKKYRQDEQSILKLDFVNSFEGMDSIRFDSVFSIK